MPFIEKNDNIITIKNLRDYNWTSTKDIENYIDFSFKILDIDSVEVGVSHFSSKEAVAHVFLVFNLKNGKSFALSIESRREKGEKFSIIGGMFFQYELIYIIATKDDLLKIREKRNEKVYLYKIKIDLDKTEKLLLLLTQKINNLYEKPEFYHIFFKNCTNLIVKEVEKISNIKFSLFVKNFAPGYSGKLLFDMSLIDTNKKTFKEVQEESLVRW